MLIGILFLIIIIAYFLFGIKKDDESVGKGDRDEGNGNGDENYIPEYQSRIFCFRMSGVGTNAVSQEWMETTHNLFCALELPYILSVDSNIIITQYWACGRMYQNVGLFQYSFLVGFPKGFSYNEATVFLQLKSEFNRLNKVWKTGIFSLNDFQVLDCYENYNIVGCG